MKRLITLLLCAGLMLSIFVSANAYDIFYQTIEAPVITNGTFGKDGKDVLSFSFTSALDTAETIRKSTYDAISELMGSQEQLLSSEYSYLASPTKNYCRISADNKTFITVAVSDKAKGNFTLDYKEDIIMPLIEAKADMSVFAETGTFYVQVLTASENITDENAKSLFTFKEAEAASFTGSKFAFIYFDVPDDAEFAPERLTFSSDPVKEDINLFPTTGNDKNKYIPSRKGYVFDGWSLNGSDRTGKIPAGEYAVILTSHWTPIEYEINYVLSTKFGYSFGRADLTDMPTTHTMGTATPIYEIESPVPGYIFDGWYSDIEFTGKKVTEIPADHAGSTVLYAKWLSLTEIADALKKRQLEYISEKKFGDIDDDGKVTAADARLILRASVGLENFTSEVLRRADYNNSGRISANNARTTLRISVGLESLYDILLANGMLDSVK